MQTDLFTAQQDDIIELISAMMNWRDISYMPVEDKKGKLVGLVTVKEILSYFNDEKQLSENSTSCIKDIMITQPITVSGDTKLSMAIDLMKDKDIGCLPVVDEGELTGIITNWDIEKL